MKALALKVAALAPDWTVRGATLACPGSLEAALSGLKAPFIYPFFMAEGYFTGEVLPERLADLSRSSRQLAPFGTDPALAALVAQTALEGAAGASIDPRAATLLLAAHGSKVSSSSKLSTLAMVRMLKSLTSFRTVTAGFVEEAPFLADAARGLGQAVCLPFFALRAGHVEDDIPRALAQAGFEGLLLPAIGEHPAVPALIAAALISAKQQAAA